MRGGATSLATRAFIASRGLKFDVATLMHSRGVMDSLLLLLSNITETLGPVEPPFFAEVDAQKLQIELMQRKAQEVGSGGGATDAFVAPSSPKNKPHKGMSVSRASGHHVSNPAGPDGFVPVGSDEEALHAGNMKVRLPPPPSFSSILLRRTA